MLARNHFAVSPTRIPRAILLSILSIVNSTLGVIQNRCFANSVADSVLEEPPLFIIGHWRTGTTYLHELMSLDKRFIAPKNFECPAPAHFILSDWVVHSLPIPLPSKRPMDDVTVGMDSPQEDEFALLNLGLPSPYETMMFPNHRAIAHKALTLTEITADEIEAWKAALSNLAKRKFQKQHKGASFTHEETDCSEVTSPHRSSRGARTTVSRNAVHSHCASPLQRLCIDGIALASNV